MRDGWTGDVHPAGHRSSGEVERPDTRTGEGICKPVGTDPDDEVGAHHADGHVAEDGDAPAAEHLQFREAVSSQDPLVDPFRELRVEGHAGQSRPCHRSLQPHPDGTLMLSGPSADPWHVREAPRAVSVPPRVRRGRSPICPAFDEIRGLDRGRRCSRRRRSPAPTWTAAARGRQPMHRCQQERAL